MKCVTRIFLPVFVFLLASVSLSYGQDYADSLGTQTYKVIKQDGGVLIGRMKKNDAIEVILVTDNLGDVVIPKHLISEIKVIDAADLDNDGRLKPHNGFHTRYFITTNGFGLKKNESYVQWNLFGPDFQVAINDRLTAGLLTSWVGIPLIGSVKTTIPVGEGVNLALGGLAGTGSYAQPSFYFTLPYAALTVGNTQRNFNVAGGYGLIGFQDNRSGGFIASVGAAAALTSKIAFVFDSFFLMSQQDERSLASGFIIPGVRWNQSENKAFQIGFAGIIANGRTSPFPLPMIQWFRRL
jgi:hypothetical protein